MARFPTDRLSTGQCVLIALAVGLAGCASPEPSPEQTTLTPTAQIAPSPQGDQTVRDAPLAIPPRFETLQIADGLVSNEVNVLLQDRQGFLWVGTFGGLSRFDGAKFRSFLHDPADLTSVAHNSINSLFEDANGILWIGTDGGLDRFDPETETFTHIRADPADSTSLGAPVVRVVVGDAGGTIWAGTWGGGLNRIDPETGAVKRIRSDPRATRPAPSVVHVLATGDTGDLWVGGDTGLSHFDPATETFTHIRRDPLDPNSPLLPVAAAICRDRGGRIWVGTRSDGLFRYDPATQQVVHYPSSPERPEAIANPWVLSLVEDHDGVIWVGTNGGGLHRYDPDRDAFERFSFDPSDLQSLRDNNVLALLVSRDGVLWVGTYGGLARRYPLSRLVAHEGVRPGDDTSLSSNDVTAFAEDENGTLYVGTNGGALNRQDPVTGAFSHIVIDPSAPGTLGSDRVFDVAVDAGGVVWTSTRAGLYHRPPSAQRFSRFVPANGRADVGLIFSFLAAGPHLWAGGDGLYDIDTETGRVVGYPLPSRFNGFSPIDIRAILRDGDGVMWVGTYTGFLRFDSAAGTWSRVELDPQAERLAPLPETAALARDASGALWVGTEDGLYRMDTRKPEIKRYHRSDGLPDTDISGLTVDRNNRLWVLTVAGLSVLDPMTGRFVSYDTQDGLGGGQRLYQSRLSGALYVGTPRGFDTFDPAALAPEPPPPAPTLTGLQVLGDDVRIGVEGSPLARALSMTDDLRLRYADRVVTFAFASLDFRAPGTHRYAVRLDGFDDDWREIGGNREATFTNLSPGSYTFRVRAAGRSGVWGSETALAITVTPPWWRAWWAYLGYFLIGALAIGAVYRYRQNRLKLQHRLEIEHIEAEQLRELNQAKSRFFANVSHEFRTPLTLTLGPLDDLLAGEYGHIDEPVLAQVSMARRSAGRVLGLINQILDVARLESGGVKLRASLTDVCEWAHEAADSFRMAAEQKSMAFIVDVPESPIQIYADPEHLDKVFANLLSNAVKFTPDGGTVRMTVEGTPNSVRIVIRDSGRGISADALPHVFDRFYRVSESAADVEPGTGIGLALTKELVDLHGGAITVESEVGFGSTFTVTLPRGRDHLSDTQIVEARVGSRKTGRQRTWEHAGTPARAQRATDGSTSESDQTTVLIVEDNADVRAYVRRHLQRTYRVVEAENGREGVELAHSALPDLILSDVMMPEVDGLELCRTLKSNTETDFIPIVLLTAKAERADKIEGLHEHADDYLTKPFDVQELLARVENLIHSRKRLRERFAGGRADESRVEIHPTADDLTSADETFLEHVRSAIETDMSSEDYGVEDLAKAVGLSRSQLNRKLKALLGQSPSDAIRSMRLERAAKMLAARVGTVSEVAYGVGFKSVSHFSNAFLDKYGCRPSAYVGVGR